MTRTQTLGAAATVLAVPAPCQSARTALISPRS